MSRAEPRLEPKPEHQLMHEALNAATAIESWENGEQWLNFAKTPWKPEERDSQRLRLTIKLLFNFAQNIENKSLQNFKFNQLISLWDFKKFLQNAGAGELKGWIQQPTGAGKTVFFGLLVKLLGVRTLILVPKKNLLKQTKEELLDILDFQEGDLGIVGGGLNEMGRAVTISTYQSHMSRMHTDNEYQKHMEGVEFVICDEAHKGLGEQTQRSIEAIVEKALEEDPKSDAEPGEMEAVSDFEQKIDQYIPSLALLTAFTATPKLADKDVGEFFGKMISRITLTQMVLAKMLKKYKIVRVEGKLETGESGNLNEEEEVIALSREQIYEKLLNKFIETKKTAPYQLRTGAFCANIAECEKFLELVEAKGLRGMIVTSKVGKDSLEEAEEKLRNGEIDMIITVDKLTEGWNFPSLNSIIWARACGSPARIIQAAGRAARLYKNEDFAYFFETDWKRKNKKKAQEDAEGGEEEYRDEVEDEDDDEDIDDKTSEEKLVHIRKGALTLERALYDSDEDTDIVCEGIDGEELKFIKFIELDDNGIGIIEATPVISVSIAAQGIYKVDQRTLRIKIEKAQIKPLKDYLGIRGSRSVKIYRKSDIDDLFPKGIKIINLDENGTGTLVIEKDGEIAETIEVVSDTLSTAMPIFGVNWKTLQKRIAEEGIRPIEGYVGNRRTQKVRVYIRSEIERIFPTKAMVRNITLDKTGKGKLTIGSETIEVVSIGSSTAKTYGVDFKKTLQRRITEKGIEPIKGYQGVDENGQGKRRDIYKKSEIDDLFPDKIVKLDQDGTATITIEKEGQEAVIEIISAVGAARKHRVDVRKTIIKRIKEAGLEPIPEYKGRIGPRTVEVYEKSKIDKLFEPGGEN